MMVGHTNKKLVMIKLLFTFIILPNITSAVDPEEFLVSKNSSKNQTLISLPTDFRNSGDQDDCCTLLLFIEVKDLPMPDYGFGMEPPKLDDTQAQTETGQVTFKFYHPQIHDNPNIFTMDVDSEKAKVREKHIVEFDKCFTMEEITFDIIATSTIMEEKDVKIVILKGKDENITCKIVPPSDSQKIVTLTIIIIVTWSITIPILGICIVMCYKYNVPQAIYQRVSTAGNDKMEMDVIQGQDDDSQPERSETKESSGAVDDVTIAPGRSQGEISRGGAGNSPENNVTKGGNRKGSRGKPRGPPKGEGSTTRSPSNENNGFCDQITYFATLIKENTPLLVASIAAVLFFVASVIATIICVCLFPSK